MEGISNAITNFFLKTPTPLIVFLTVGLTVILYTPDHVASSLYVLELRKTHGSWLGLSFIIAIGMIAAKAWAVGSNLRTSNKKLAARLKYLSTLTAEEKGYLTPFIFDDATVIYVDPTDGVVGTLQAKGILRQASPIGSLIEGFPYGIQPWALEALTENKHLLDGAGPPPMTPRQKRRDEIKHGWWNR